jgi:hypothetical protein
MQDPQWDGDEGKADWVAFMDSTTATGTGHRPSPRLRLSVARALVEVLTAPVRI